MHNTIHSITNELIPFRIIKSIYNTIPDEFGDGNIKNKAKKDKILIPLIDKLFNIVSTQELKNNITYTSFDKEFLIYPNIFYINKKYKSIFDPKSSNIGIKMDLYLINHLKNYIDKFYLNKNVLGKISNILGFRKIELVYKKVQGRLEKFILKEKFHNNKLLGFLKYSDKRVFFYPKSASEMRAIKQMNRDKIETEEILDLNITINNFKKLYQNNLYSKLFLYFLMIDILKEIRLPNSKLKKVKNYENLVNIYISMFVGYNYLNNDIKDILGFNRYNINIFSHLEDREAIKKFLSEYFVLLLYDFKRIK